MSAKTPTWSFPVLLEDTAAAVVFLLPLVFWPSAASPFSSAKQWLLLSWIIAASIAAGLGGLVLARPIPTRLLLALGSWIAALSLSAGLGAESSLHAFLGGLLPCIGLPLLFCTVRRPERIVSAMIWGGTIVAAIAILQYLRLDPFQLAGLKPTDQGSIRMRVFSTLGNPNFVAAYIVSLLPLTFIRWSSLRTKGQAVALPALLAVLLQAGSVIASGSRAAVIAIAAACLWLSVRRCRLWAVFAMLGLIVIACLLIFSPARPLGKTTQGRIYIWKVVLGNIGSIPPFGQGPGAFPLRFARWETGSLKALPDLSNPTYAGLQDHAHNDYLEIVVDHGFVGLGAFAFTIALIMFGPSGWRQERALEDGLVASVLALLAVAFVDFPLHRPSEHFLLWTLLALLWIPGGAEAASGAMKK